MPHKICLLVTFIVAVYACKAINNNQNTENQPSCDQFKIGDFIITLDNSKELTIVNRNEFFQTEIYNGDTTIYQINWIDKCSYSLINDQTPELIVIIEKTTNKGYDFDISVRNSPQLLLLSGSAIIDNSDH